MPHVGRQSVTLQLRALRCIIALLLLKILIFGEFLKNVFSGQLEAAELNGNHFKALSDTHNIPATYCNILQHVQHFRNFSS